MLLDVMLPGTDGLNVCATLRRRGCWAPVLMLTARGRVPDRIAGLDVGADGYPAKPFAFDELLARLRALVRRAPARRPVRLEVGDLVVDPATHEVLRAGTPVELTAREFAVLEFLARHPGQAVTRTRLLEHVWDENFEGQRVLAGPAGRQIGVRPGRPPASPAGRPPFYRPPYRTVAPFAAATGFVALRGVQPAGRSKRCGGVEGSSVARSSARSSPASWPAREAYVNDAYRLFPLTEDALRKDMATKQTVIVPDPKP